MYASIRRNLVTISEIASILLLMDRAIASDICFECVVVIAGRYSLPLFIIADIIIFRNIEHDNSNV